MRAYVSVRKYKCKCLYKFVFVSVSVCVCVCVVCPRVSARVCVRVRVEEGERKKGAKISVYISVSSFCFSLFSFGHVAPSYLQCHNTDLARPTRSQSRQSHPDASLFPSGPVRMKHLPSVLSLGTHAYSARLSSSFFSPSGDSCSKLVTKERLCPAR